MRLTFAAITISLAAWCLFVRHPFAHAQASVPELATTVDVEFPRLAGTDEGSGIAYTLVSMQGRIVGPAKQQVPPPRLTAQCTQHPDGKLYFELLADAGGVTRIIYVPPWKPTKELAVEPPVAKLQVKMDFLGYTKVKPVTRRWRTMREIHGELRYDTPGLHSANMEEIMFYLQYLKALPTLRLTIPDTDPAKPAVVVEFETAKWQARVKAEPLCWASAL